MVQEDQANPLPSREDLLRLGGLYPVPVPLGWKLIGAQGEDVTIPAIAGDPYHRFLARGELLATEHHGGHLAELMMLRKYRLPGPPSADILKTYTELVLATLTKQGVAPRVVSKQIARCALSPLPCAKLIVERNSSGDSRTEIHYLVSDRTSLNWELVYLLRRDNLSSWAPLLAEIDGPQTVVR